LEEPSSGTDELETLKADERPATLQREGKFADGQEALPKKKKGQGEKKGTSNCAPI